MADWFAYTPDGSEKSTVMLVTDIQEIHTAGDKELVVLFRHKDGALVVKCEKDALDLATTAMQGKLHAKKGHFSITSVDWKKTTVQGL